MFSVEKTGKIKKQLDRYFLPMEINPNIIMDLMRIEERKNSSPIKLKQETLTKIPEEVKRVELLKVTGRELNSNFTVLPMKPKGTSRERKISPKKEIYKYRIQQILSEPLEDIMHTISRDPDSHLFSRELEELQKYRTSQKSETQLKGNKNAHVSLFTQASKDANYRNRFENMIMSNPVLYKRMLVAYHKIENQKMEKAAQEERNQKRVSISEAFVGRRPSKAFRKIINSEKELQPNQIKKLNNFIQYRQFLMVVNLSNRIIIFPESETNYKAFVGKGNNSILVKSIVKSRPWWVLRSVSDLDNCNLVWTEWKKTKLTNSLPCKQSRMQKSSFYTSNYYYRINQDYTDNEGQRTQKFDSRYCTKSEQFRVSSPIVQTRNLNIQRIANIQKILPSKLINDEEGQSNYYSFTKKINEKKCEQLLKRNLPNQPSYFCYNQLKSRQKTAVILNHVPGCLQLHSKKLLFLNMKRYYQKNNKNVFDFLPETYVIKDGLEDPTFEEFVHKFSSIQADKNDANLKSRSKNVWICKPGENSNRGNGINVVSTIDEVKNLIKSMNGMKRSLIVQKYIQNPYLYNKRKFDIRCYLLITTINGILKGYFYNEGYIRTTSKQYTLKNLENKFVHLTNDAIQKKGEEYGKYEGCNKLSFSEFQKYVDSIDKEETPKFAQARVRIKEMASEIVKSVANKLNPTRKQFCFELFGLDFMLDSRMNPLLIQANSNPCLQVDGSVLSKIIPNVIQNTIRIAIDPIFPPPYSQNWKTSRFAPGNSFDQNKFQIVYDSIDDFNRGESIMVDDGRGVDEEDEEGEADRDNQFQ